MDNRLDIDALFSLESPSDLPPPPVSPRYDPSSLLFLEGIHRRKSDALKAFVAEHGWPTAARFSEQAEAAAFMIVQHADYDPDFQKLCHSLMRECAKLDRLPLGYLAFLTDRILCNEGQYQRFGTQIREVTNGCFVPKPIEDAGQIDALREKVGLNETLSDYFIRVNAGDLLLYRPLLNGYAEELEERKASKILKFPKNKNN